MAESNTRKRALEILADPNAKEHEWMGALSILEGRVPSINKPYRRKFARFLKRVAGLSIVYAVFFSVYGLIFYGSGFYWGVLSLAFFWALLETLSGFFTAFALVVMLTSLGPVISPGFHATWMVIAINLFSYARFNWRPYIFAPLFKALSMRSPDLSQIEQR